MHALQSLQLVTLLTQPIVSLVPGDELNERFTNSFWGISKCREQRWKKSISNLTPKLKAAQRPDESWAEYAQLAEEIIISEMLTRIWLAKVLSTAKEQEDLSMIADLVIAEHAQLRKSVVKLLDYLNNRDHLSRNFKNSLHQLQASVMESTDMFLAHMENNPFAQELAFNSQLCGQIAENVGTQPIKSMVKICQKIGESVYASLQPVTTGVAHTPDLNGQIMDCISECLSQDLAI